MTGKQKHICLAVLICTSLFIGCGPSTKNAKPPRTNEVRTTPTDEHKAKLLKQLNRRFENPDAHFELGQLYHADGMWAQAEYHYNTAMSFDPAHRNSQAAMVKLLLDNGNKDKAKLSADIYINQVCASAEESLRLAIAFQKQKLDDYALLCYRQALNLAPNSPKINRQIGYYYLSKNDKDRAKDYLARSFQLDSNQPEVAGELGRLGVAVRIPRKIQKSTGQVDRIVDESRKEQSP